MAAIVASRYAADSSAAGLGGLGLQSSLNKSNVQSTSPSDTTTTQNSTQNTASNSNTIQNTSSTTKTSQTNMDPQSKAALDLLIKQLMGGGTQQMAEDRARRIQEIQALQSQRAGYTKDAAFADAQGAMAGQLRAVLEKIAPSLVRAAQGAGTSQSSLRALLTQDMAARAAEASASTGLQAATSYGGINAQLSGVLSNLINSPDPVAAALLQALNIAKGATSSSTSSTNGTTTGSTSTTGSTNTNTQTQQTDDGKTVNTVYPGDVGVGGTMSSVVGSSYNPLGLSQSAQDYLAGGGYNPMGANRASGSDAYDLVSRVTF
jgi:hypothetical protein